jgi:hypothetical protein
MMSQHSTHLVPAGATAGATGSAAAPDATTTGSDAAAATRDSTATRSDAASGTRNSTTTRSHAAPGTSNSTTTRTARTAKAAKAAGTVTDAAAGVNSGGDLLGGQESTPPRVETRAAVAAYTELARIVLGAEPLGAVMSRIAELAQQAIPGADEVSVTLIEGGRAWTVAFSGPLAGVLDERQYDVEHGPCIDAAVTGQTIAIDDTGSDQVYPEFSRQAYRHGIRHALAVGMPTLHGTTGALNIYGTGSHGPFDAAARDVAAGFVGYAAVALGNAALLAGALDQVAQMKEAMSSRSVIEQAKGVIMTRRHCDAAAAFDILRSTSMRSNRKLRDVAATIVAGAVNGD